MFDGFVRGVAVAATFGLVVFIWWAMGEHAALQAEPGIYGDKFGAVNALFSGLAFAGIVITILLQ